ncbi:MAG TPA: tetratricopeptide repeat protein [Thermoanaerobaculia bacterium]|nr:tetratricopeptide repeat protein [Thermoanaerobaculia bacterium]
MAGRSRSRIARFGTVAALLTGLATAAPPTTCGAGGDYERALCAYQRRNFAEAEALFGKLASEDRASPRKLKATYFLARTHMKQGKFAEAGELFIRIYALDRAFYDGWACDFLLGECRRAVGKG